MGSSSCIYKEKKKNIRICADYSIGLNDCLKEISYPLPTAKEIFANLNGGRIFSKLDLSVAYLQIPVEEKCAELLTINTHRGLFKITRHQYGIKVSSNYFSKNNGYNVSRSGLRNSLFR